MKHLIASTVMALLLSTGATMALAAPPQGKAEASSTAITVNQNKDGSVVAHVSTSHAQSASPAAKPVTAKQAAQAKQREAKAESVSRTDGAQPFMRRTGSDAGDMTQVADWVTKSLARDASGRSPISPELCAKNRSCITPLELFTQIKEKHPDVGIGDDVSGLASYLGTLVKNEHPGEGKRTVGRVLIKNRVRKMDYGYSRMPAPGEAVWTDVNTGEEVLMGNCLNTIDLTTVSEVVVEAPCAYHLVAVHPGDRAVNFALMGEYQNDKCFKYTYLGSSLENADDQELKWSPLPTHCPDKPCSFAKFEDYYKQPILQSGGLAVKAGYYLFSVSTDFAKSRSNIAVYCLDHGPDAAEGLRHSCSVDIHDTDYHHGSWGGMQATIFYDLSEVPKTWTGRRLWWEMPDKAGNCPPD
jgi:hypothetical protein